MACAGCHIGCAHIASLKSPISPRHESEVRKVSYDLELIYSLGTDLGVSSTEGVLELIDSVERWAGSHVGGRLWPGLGLSRPTSAT